MRIDFPERRLVIVALLPPACETAVTASLPYPSPLWGAKAASGRRLLIESRCFAPAMPKASRVGYSESLRLRPPPPTPPRKGGGRRGARAGRNPTKIIARRRSQ